MLKTFTLNKRDDVQISETTGKVTFHITDENNVSRSITATTFLNENKLPQGVTSKNMRELPLVEGLFRLEIGENIEIEFKYFNKYFDRDLNKTVNQVAYDKVIGAEKERRLFNRLHRIFKKSSKNKISASLN